MWKVSAGRKVAIGFSGINKTWVGLADQDNFTEINKMSEISSKGTSTELINFPVSLTDDKMLDLA